MAPKSTMIRSQLHPAVITTGLTHPVGRKNGQRPIVSNNHKAGSLPPVFVIRATSHYEAQEPTELSFKPGDFFHVKDVLTDKNGYAWFQVENPLKPLAQGLVPATHFQKYGPTRPVKLVPIRKNSDTSPTEPQSHKDSPHLTLPLSIQSKPSSTPHPPPKLRPRTLTLGCRSLFGIVKYPFLAERADEMNAKCGEPVIIVAHSAQEWFVVKPICRLGPPGLIPASYVEIQEIQTCRVLSSDQVADLMKTSAIPTVDEWKKIVADHRARCISLGVVTDEDDLPRPNSPKTVGDTNRSNHDDYSIEHLADWRQRQATFIESTQQNNGLSCVEEEDEGDVDPNDQSRKERLILWKAQIISFHYEQGQFWYQVQAHLRNSNGVQGGQTLVLYRLDSHFRKLESDLERESSSENCELPKLPASATITDAIACACRMEQLRAYLDQVCTLPESVRMSGTICEFFSAKAGDMELDSIDEEIKTPLEESNPKFNAPIIQLPLESNEPYTTSMDNSERSFGNSAKSGESLLSDDVRSWITSWQATTADECRFSNGRPSPSTRPSSINSRCPSPTTENSDVRKSSFQLYPRHSLWIPDLDKLSNDND